jgi:hypothetical protein
MSQHLKKWLTVIPPSVRCSARLRLLLLEVLVEERKQRAAEPEQTNSTVVPLQRLSRQTSQGDAMMEPEEDPEPHEETGEPHTNNASRAAPSESSAVGGGRRGYQSVENPVLIAGNASSSTNLCMKILTACTIALVLDVLLLSLYIHRKDPPSGRGDNGWLFSESRDTDWTKNFRTPPGLSPLETGTFF